MRSLHYRGDYEAAAAIGDALSAKLRSHPQIALQRGRNRLRQGHLDQAAMAFSEADNSMASPGEQLILELEKVSLLIYRGKAIIQSLHEAEALLQNFKDQVSSVEWAEAKRIHIRLLMIAAIYREIPADRAAHERDCLSQIAETLEAANYLDESLAARFTYAEHLPDLQTCLDALKTLAKLAIELERPGIAGEAYLRRAERLLAAGAPQELIHTELDQSEEYYSQNHHIHGPIDIQCVRSRLAIAQHLKGPEVLEVCLNAYREIGLSKQVLSLLIDLSQLALENGDLSSAVAYRQESLAFAIEMDMALFLGNFQLSQIDLLTRNGSYGEAIEFCKEALLLNPPRFLTGSFEQLLATAYSFVNDLDSAITHIKKAIAIFQTVGDDKACSSAVSQLVSFLDSYRAESAWQEAEQLLENWVSRAEKAGDLDSALTMQSILFQIFFNRYYYSPNERGNPTLLESAQQVLINYESLLPQLPNQRERSKKFGSLCQLRGMLAQARNDQAKTEALWEEALAVYESSGMMMEAANCRYILGAINLNQTNASDNLVPYFGKAETYFQSSLQYYEQAAIRRQAGDTCFMLARHYTNTARRIQIDIRTQMLDAALEYLVSGEANFDAMRREFTSGTTLQAQQSKQSITEQSWRLYDLALQLLVGDRPDASKAWEWTQRAKARSLGDAMGSGIVPLARVIQDISHHPKSHQLLMNQQDIVRRLDRVSPEQRSQLKQELVQVQQKMSEDPHLQEYLELRTGVAITLEDVETLQASEQQTCVCLDWVKIDQTLWLFVKRPSKPPTHHRLTLNMDDVQQFINQYLTPTANLRSSLRDIPECLEILNPLIEPLATHTQPNELLILSPTGLLHAIPLHALTLDGQVLLERNPVVYCPSLGILRYSIARRKFDHGEKSAAFFGDPTGDRRESRELVRYLAHKYKTEPYLTGAITRASFIAMLSSNDLVHFQGHAEHIPHDPLNSHLILADGQLTAREIFGISNIRTEHVILAACESAVNVLKTGDEPLGLIPAFLVAGTRTVLATLWKVHQSSTVQVMRGYHDTLFQGNSTLNKAEALRQSVLALRQNPNYSAPYHWAPFILYGDWQ